MTTEETNPPAVVLSTAQLAGKPFIEALGLQQATMTHEQQQIAEMGVCPKCCGKLHLLSAAEEMSFNGCEQCHDVWVLTANAIVSGLPHKGD